MRIDHDDLADAIAGVFDVPLRDLFDARRPAGAKAPRAFQRQFARVLAELPDHLTVSDLKELLAGLHHVQASED